MARQKTDTPHVAGIARELGISSSTVSKVINGRPGVSRKTRERVEVALAEQGYRHPLVSTKIAQTIELVVDYIANNGTIEMIRFASKWALRAGLALTVTQTDNQRKTQECLRGIIDRNPLGVILQMSAISQENKARLRARGIPLVAIDPVTLVEDEDMSITLDNWTGGYQAAKCLLDAGHRRIGVVSGPLNVQSAQARLAGYAAAMKAAGFTLDQDLVEQGDYLPDKGYRAVGNLLDRGDRPTAILTCNDLTAVNAYRAARERHLEPGRDISIVGFDNVYPSSYLMPSLTTVDQPFDLMARKAVEMILDARNGHEFQRHVVMPTRLVVRHSVVNLLDPRIRSDGPSIP